MPSDAERLRILTVTHNYPRFVGDPAGAFVARIAEGVAARGHEVEILAPHAPGAPVDEQVRGVAVHRFRYAPEPLERIAYTGGLHQTKLASPAVALGLPGFLIACGLALRGAIHRFQPDLIHAHWWLPAGWFARWSGRPYLVTCHGSDVRLLERGAFFRRQARQVLDRAGGVTTVSNFLAGDLRRLLPALHVVPIVAPMPVDTDSFQSGAGVPKAEPPRILYAGNLVQSKGVDILLRAAATLVQKGLDFHLKILGEGPEQTSLHRLAADLKLADRITWSNFVSQTRMPAEYGASTITILPSRGQAEGLGLTLVEALLAGSAVVGTRTGGIPEVVRHEETGLLAREGDAQDLARQIARLLGDRELRDRLTRAGKQHVLQTYSPATAVQRFIAIYHAVADHHPDH